MRAPRELWRDILQPPSVYYDLDNRKGTSPFRPGLAPEAYVAFVAYFDERAQTAAAQARLDRRKGRADQAERFEAAARLWARAAAVALRRKFVASIALTASQAAAANVLADVPRTSPPTFEWDDELEVAR